VAESAARTLLVNVPDPAELVAEMVRLAARAAVMEPDSEYPRCYPPQPALDLVRSMRPRVLKLGLASQAQLAELDAAARAHLDDPPTIAVPGLLFLAWGRDRPEDASGDGASPRRGANPRAIPPICPGSASGCSPVAAAPIRRLCARKRQGWFRW
jgi:hypothetical protein